MTTMGGWRGVYLAGLLMVPLTSAIQSTTEDTNATMTGNVYTPSPRPGPTTAKTSTLVFTAPPSNLTTTGSESSSQEAATTLAANSTSLQPQTTTAGLSQSTGSTEGLSQSASSAAGPVSIATTPASAGKFRYELWGGLFVGVITLCTAVLCWLIITLRRKSRGYSFDLQRPVMLMDPPGTFESVKIDALNTFPAANGACLSGPGEGVANLVLPLSSSCLALDAELMDRKSEGDRSESPSHVTEEEEEEEEDYNDATTAT